MRASLAREGTCIAVKLRKFGCGASLDCLLVVMVLAPAVGAAAKHPFDMTIADTKITLVDNQTFHTFAFNGQVPGALIHALKLKPKGE